MKQRTLRVMAVFAAAYLLLLAPGWLWPAYFDSPAGLLLVAPLFSIYAFHKLGIPGLLEHNGLCGWGWCAPTVFGWVFLAIVWLLLAAALAACIAAVTLRMSNRGRERSP